MNTESVVNHLLEGGGTALGMLGAWFVSGAGARARWGWAIWLGSNFLLGALAARLGLWMLLAMQCYFSVTSARGWLRSRTQ